MAIATSRSVDRALKALGQSISLARRRRAMSQADLASRMGASVSTVRRLKDEHFGASMAQLMGQTSQFALAAEQALAVVRRVVNALGSGARWVNLRLSE